MSEDKSNSVKNEVIEIPVDELIRDENQPRQFKDGESSLKSLVENIRNSGILEPIQYRVKGDKKIIVMGERRWKAAKEAGYKTVPAMEYKSELDYRLAAFNDNLDRKKLLPMEEAQYLKRIFDEMHQNTKIPQKDFAKQVGMSEASFSEKIGLTELPQEIQDEALKGPQWTTQKLLQLKKFNGDSQKYAFEVMKRSNTEAEANFEYANEQIRKWKKSLNTMKKKIEKEIPTSLPTELKENFTERIQNTLAELDSIYKEMEEACKTRSDDAGNETDENYE